MDEDLIDYLNDTIDEMLQQAYVVGYTTAIDDPPAPGQHGPVFAAFNSYMTARSSFEAGTGATIREILGAIWDSTQPDDEDGDEQ